MISYSKQLYSTRYSYNGTATTFLNTSVVSSESGYEKRNANWEMPLHEFSVSYDVQDENKKEYLLNFQSQHRGQAIAFKFKDWSDYVCKKEASTINKGLGLSGKPFAELYKKYSVTTDFEPTYRRIAVIAKKTDEPDEYVDTFKIFFNNEEKTDVQIDYDNGYVFFNYLSRFEISSISNENPAIVTLKEPHNFADGDKIWIDLVDNGDNKINKKLFKITKIDDYKFSINYPTINFGNLLNGYAYKYPQDSEIDVKWSGWFYCKVRFAEDNSAITMTNFNIYTISARIKEIK